MPLVCQNADCNYSEVHGPITDAGLQYCPDCGQTLKRIRASALPKVQPAGRGRRFAGLLVDCIIMFPIFLTSLITIVGQEIAALCFVLFLLFRDINGRSPGKLVTGTTVVGRAGSPSTAKQRLLRNLPFAVTVLPLFIPFLGYVDYWILSVVILIEAVIVLAVNKRFGDQIAGTIVVKRSSVTARPGRVNLEI